MSFFILWQSKYTKQLLQMFLITDFAAVQISDHWIAAVQFEIQYFVGRWSDDPIFSTNELLSLNIKSILQYRSLIIKNVDVCI